MTLENKAALRLSSSAIDSHWDQVRPSDRFSILIRASTSHHQSLASITPPVVSQASNPRRQGAGEVEIEAIRPRLHRLELAAIHTSTPALSADQELPPASWSPLQRHHAVILRVKLNDIAAENSRYSTHLNYLVADARLFTQCRGACLFFTKRRANRYQSLRAVLLCIVLNDLPSDEPERV